MNRREPDEPSEGWHAWLVKGAEWARVVLWLLALIGGCALVLALWP